MGIRQSYLFICLFWWDWGLKTGLWACKAGTLLIEPHLLSILPWLFWKWGLKII
jgi:hypothetical protein